MWPPFASKARAADATAWTMLRNCSVFVAKSVSLLTYSGYAQSLMSNIKPVRKSTSLIIACRS